MMNNATEFTYLLLSPPYRENSLGVQVVHYLCHMLNERGYPAYMINCTVNPQWNTPLLSELHYQQLLNSGRPFIAIYAEIYQGNPLLAPVVARYMLNREGVMNSNSVNAGDEDLFFWYRKEFADKEANPNILRIDMQDLNLFCDDHPEKDLDLLYLNRVPVSGVNFAELPPGIQVLSMDKPLSLVDLAAVLKRARVLYSYESSGTCALANLCGCPVVAKRAAGYEHLAINSTTLIDNGGGMAWSDDPVELATVKNELWRVRDFYLNQRREMVEQVDEFIRLTQQKARIQAIRCPSNNFAHWLDARQLTTGQQDRLTTQLGVKPLSFAIVVQCHGRSVMEINATLESLTQTRVEYPHFQVVLVGEISATLALPAWVTTAGTVPVPELLNQLAAMQPTRWLQIVEAGTRYTASGLLITAATLAQCDEGYVAFTDRAIEQNTDGLQPDFRSDFNHDLLLSLPHSTARHWLFRSKHVLAAGGFSVELTHSCELEMILRLLETHGSAGIVHLTEVVTLLPAMPLPDPQESSGVILRHLQRRGYAHAQIEPSPQGVYRLHYGHQQILGASILIPAGEDLAQLQQCLQKLFGETDWPDYEVIIACHRGCPAEVTDWLDEAVKHIQARLRVVRCTSAFNPAALFNAMARQATTEYLLLLDVNALVVQRHWLKNLFNHALRSEVAAVGGMLINYHQQVLSAGILTGLRGIAGNAFSGLAREESGYMQRLQADQNYSALSAACLMVKKQSWQACGGLNERLPIRLCGEVDLCLRLRERGEQLVWTPWSVMAFDHLSTYSQCKIDDEAANRTFLQRWLSQLAADPAGNPNFSSNSSQCIPEWDLTRCPLPPSWRTQPSVLAVHTVSGRNGRLMLDILHGPGTEEKLVVTGNSVLPSLPFCLQLQPDVLMLHLQPGKDTDQWLDQLSQLHTGFTSGMPAAGSHQEKGGLSRTWCHLDRLLVHSAAAQEMLAKHHPDVRLLPLQLAPRWHGLQRDLSQREKMRIACITLDATPGDLALINNLIRDLHQQVEWVMMGPYPAHWLPWITENHRFAGCENFPQQLCALNVELALVPREDTRRNRQLNPLILLELAACGIPAVCSDVSSLHSHIPMTVTRNSYQHWTSAVLQHVENRDATRQLGDSLTDTLRAEDWLNEKSLAAQLALWMPD